MKDGADDPHEVDEGPAAADAGVEEVVGEPVFFHDGEEGVHCYAADKDTGG